VEDCNRPSAVCVFSRGYPTEDIDAIIDRKIDDPRPPYKLYDEMTKELDELSKVCIVAIVRMILVILTTVLVGNVN